MSRRTAMIAIRALIEGDGPADEHEARRVAFRATAGILDPSRAANLQQEFLEVLLSIILGDASEQKGGQEGRRAAIRLLDEIESTARQVVSE